MNKRIKQSWLAEKLGKSYNMVNSYFQNRRQTSVGDLFRIGELLQIDSKELLFKEKLQKNKEKLSLK